MLIRHSQVLHNLISGAIVSWGVDCRAVGSYWSSVWLSLASIAICADKNPLAFACGYPQAQGPPLQDLQKLSGIKQEVPPRGEGGNCQIDESECEQLPCEGRRLQGQPVLEIQNLRDDILMCISALVC